MARDGRSETSLFEQLLGDEKRKRLYRALNEVAEIYRGHDLPVSYLIELAGTAVIVTLSDAKHSPPLPRATPEAPIAPKKRR